MTIPTSDQRAKLSDLLEKFRGSALEYLNSDGVEGEVNEVLLDLRGETFKHLPGLLKGFALAVKTLEALYKDQCVCVDEHLLFNPECPSCEPGAFSELALKELGVK